MARATRRTFLGASALTALSGLPAAVLALPGTASADTAVASHPDAELLALIVQFDELENRISATFRGAETQEQEAAEEAIREPLQAEQYLLLDKIVDTPTTTLEGFRARARSYARWYEGWDNGSDPEGFQNERMAWALVRDLIGETA